MSKKKVLNIAWITDVFDRVSGILTDTTEFHEQSKKFEDINIYPITCFKEEIESFYVFKPVFKIPIGKIYKDTSLYVPNFFDVVSYLRRKEVNFIVSNTPASMGFLAMSAAAYLKIPWFDIYHTDLDFYYKTLVKGTGRVFVEVLYKQSLHFYQKKADLIFVRSKFFLHDLKKKHSKKNIHILPAGVDFNVFNPKNKDRTIWEKYNINPNYLILFFAGRISKVKDILFILWAMKKYRWKEVEVVIVGDGLDFKEYYNEYNSVDHIHFLGIKYNPELSIMYASADFFIMPSSSETLGKTVLESMASGTPVLVSDRGGPSHYVKDQHSGVIFEGGDYYDFLEKLKNIIEKKYDIKKMGNNSLESIQEHSIEKLFDLFVDIIRKYQNKNKK